MAGASALNAALLAQSSAPHKGRSRMDMVCMERPLMVKAAVRTTAHGMVMPGRRSQHGAPINWPPAGLRVAP